MNNKLATNIQEAIDIKNIAVDKLNKVLKEVQSKCNHEIVAEVPWDSIGNASRICLHCRLIEIGSDWSGGTTWSEKDFKVAILGNSDNRVITTISRDDFYKLRM
jgi:hypothetical protein